MRFKSLTKLLGGLFLALWCTAALAQTRTVKGNVVDEAGIPVIGAFVTVEGASNIGTLTDLDGNFNLAKVPANAKNLIVSFMGYADAKVPVQDFVRVVLQEDANVLESAVVTGMTQMDRRLFSGSAVKVDADEAKISGMADISRSLEGRVAGVSVQNVSGTFGTAPQRHRRSELGRYRVLRHPERRLRHLHLRCPRHGRRYRRDHQER